MIIEIRNQFKAQGFKIVLIVVTLAMIVSFAPFLNKDDAATRGGLIMVNGKAISLVTYQLRMKSLVDRLRLLAQQLGVSAEVLTQNFNPETLAYQSVIEEELLNESAEKAKLSNSPGYIALRLHDPQFMQAELGDVVPWHVYNQDGSINTQALHEYLQTNGISGDQFETMIANAVRRSLMRDIVSIASIVTDADVRAYFSAHNLAKAYEILTFKRKDYEDKEAARALSDKELKDYFEAENKRSKKYIIPEKRSGKAFIFSPEHYGIAVNEKDIKQFYDLNKAKKYADMPAQIKLRKIVFNVANNASTEDVQAVEKKAQGVLAELKADPKKFAELAKKHSQDATAAQGGLTGFLAKGSMDQAVEAAAFRLKEDGDISELLVTPQGFEIIQRVEKKAPTYKSFDSVKDAIKAILSRQKFSVLFGQDMSKMVHRIDSNPAEFQAFVAQKKGTEQVINFGAKNDSHFTQKLFKMKKGAWTYYFNDKMGIALKLEDIQKSSTPALSAVKDQVAKDLHASRIEKKLAADVKKASEMAQKGDAASIGKQLGARYEKTDFIKPQDSAAMERYTSQGIPLAQVKNATQAGAVASVTEVGDGYVVKVAAIEPFDATSFTSFQAEIRKNLERQREKAVVQGFVASLYRNATIKPIDSNVNIK